MEIYYIQCRARGVLTHALRLSCRRPTAPPSALLPRKPDRRAGGWFVAHKSCRSPDGIHAAARQSDRYLMQLYASEVTLADTQIFVRLHAAKPGRVAVVARINEA